MNGESYTPERILFLKTHGTDMSTKELCSALNKQFNTTHSAQSVRTTAKKHGVRKSQEQRSAVMQARGAKLGASCIVNGYEYIRVGKGKGFYQNWARKSRLVWEAQHGVIPEGYMVVFLNGDTLDCRPQNLACISKSVAARMARGHGKKLWSSFEEVTRAAIKACELDEALSKLRKED